MALAPPMALHSDATNTDDDTRLRARGRCWTAMRLACSCTMLSTLSGTTSLSSERLSVMVEVLKNSP